MKASGGRGRLLPVMRPLQLDQGRRRGTAGRSDGETLNRAGDEQPADAVFASALRHGEDRQRYG